MSHTKLHTTGGELTAPAQTPERRGAQGSSGPPVAMGTP